MSCSTSVTTAGYSLTVDSHCGVDQPSTVSTRLYHGDGIRLRSQVGTFGPEGAAPVDDNAPVEEIMLQLTAEAKKDRERPPAERSTSREIDIPILAWGLIPPAIEPRRATSPVANR